MALNRLKNRLEKRGLKENTIETHMRNMRIILDGAGIKTITEKNKDKIVNFIDNERLKRGGKTSNNTKKARYKCILAYLRDGKRKKLYKEFNDIYSEISGIVDKQLGENKLKPEEKENYTEWKELKKLDQSRLNENQKIFLSFIFNDELFLRLSYFKIKLKNYDEDNDNYIKNGVLYMNDFKNVAKLGSQKFTLSKKTLELVKNIDNEYLFTNHSYKHPAHSSFITKLFKKTINKSLNNNLLRKIYVNSFDLGNMTNNEIDKIAKRMLNTRETLLNNYKKVD
jgi:hypothetical protein